MKELPGRIPKRRPKRPTDPMPCDIGELGKVPILNHLQQALPLELVAASWITDIVSALAERGITTVQDYLNHGLHFSEPGGNCEQILNLIRHQYTKKVRKRSLLDDSEEDFLFMSDDACRGALSIRACSSSNV